MKRLMTLALATMLAAMPQSLPAAAAEAGGVNVTINYTGKGTVDGSHRVWVWLFSSPDIGPGAMPIAEASVDTNGGVAVFEGITAEQVWIAAAFDEQGVMRGNAPPPSGAPVGIYVSSDGVPRAVSTTATADAALSFDDSQRMP